LRNESAAGRRCDPKAVEQAFSRLTVPYGVYTPFEKEIFRRKLCLSD
jgi:hypothetical protein